MCEGPEVDTTVQDQMLKDSRRARQEEQQRKQRINRGTRKVNQTFRGFNKGFYEGYKGDYMDAYMPEVDQKFGNAQDDLTFALARAGTLNSSMAGDRVAELNDGYASQKAGIVSGAQDAASKLKSSVAGEKSNIIGLLNATGDANAAVNSALSRSSQLFQEQPSYNPLGDIFAGAASGIGAYYAGQQNQNAMDTYFRGTSPSGGSSRVIR